MNIDKIYAEAVANEYSVKDERRYVMAFYLNGLMAIIGEWIKCDCEDPIEKIVGVMQDCVQKLKK